MDKQRKLEFGAEEDQVVAKANQLIQGRHDFTTAEQRIFVSMIAKLDRDMETFPEQKIRFEDVCKPPESIRVTYTDGWTRSPIIH
mgnify:CR=1 FL=1